MLRFVRRLYTSRAGYTKLALLAAWVCLIKLLAVVVFTPATESIFHISFGFGGFIESLDTAGKFQSCTDGFCTYSTRMPALPLFFAAIGLVTENMLAAALIKSVLLTIVVVIGFRYLIRLQAGSDAHKTGAWFLVALVLGFSPTVIKHAATVHYEEGFLIELLFLWCFAFLVALHQWADSASDRVRRDGVVVFALTLSTLAYLLKSSMIAVLALSLLLAAVWFLRTKSRRVLVAAVLSLTCVTGWGVRNLVVTDHFSVMTSFDGQNSYRGMSSEGRQLFPELYLDRMFDSKVAYLPDGERIPLVPLPAIADFKDEWAQDRYYKTKSAEWLLAHPGEWVGYTVKKAWNFFGGVHKTPYTYSNDARGLRPNIEDRATMLWLIGGRALEVAMVALLIGLWRRRDRITRTLCVGVVAANLAYAAPYLVGFNYERHVTTYLVIVAACVGVLLTEFLRGRTRDPESEPQPEDEAATP